MTVVDDAGFKIHVYPEEMLPLIKLFNRIDQTDLTQQDKDSIESFIDEFKSKHLAW
jgi:hypothetical protein